MDDKVWWIAGLKGAFIAGGTALLAWLIHRARLRSQSPADVNKMRHTTPFLWLGVIGASFFPLFFVVLFLAGVEMTGIVYVPLTSLPGLFILWIGFVEKHELSPTGLRYRTIFARWKFIRWSDVVELTYWHGAKWFRIKSCDGTIARVSVLLTGLPRFATLALAHVPRSALSAGDEQVLRETASGNPPSAF